MRPTRTESMMDIARILSNRSTCSRAQVGCIISREGRPLSLGYNGAPAGMPHCDHECDGGFSDPVYQPPEAHHATCRMVSPCRISVHAEANAIAWAARNGSKLQDSVLSSTRVPCTPCAQLIINAGIIAVVYEEDHRDMGGLALLEAADIHIERVI
jgi:dCMP deaminase